MANLPTHPRDEKGRFIKLYTIEEQKERQRESIKKWQATDAGRESSQKSASKYRSWRRAFLHEYKKGLSCIYCGITNPLCIDFDHKNPEEKKFNISKAITGGMAMELIVEEIAKCQPVCRNCHGIKTIIQDNKLREHDIEPFIPESMKRLFDI